MVVSGQEQHTIKPNYVVNFLELIVWGFFRFQGCFLKYLRVQNLKE